MFGYDRLLYDDIATAYQKGSTAVGANDFTSDGSPYITAYPSYDQGLLQSSSSGLNTLASSFNGYRASETNATTMNQMLSTDEAHIGVDHNATPNLSFGHHHTGPLMSQLSTQFSGSPGNVISGNGLWNGISRCYYLY